MERAICIREGGQNMSVPRWEPQKNSADTRRKKREKVRAGPGPRECEAGYETNNCGELRVALDEEGHTHRKWGGQNMGVSRWEPQTETLRRERLFGMIFWGSNTSNFR